MQYWPEPNGSTAGVAPWQTNLLWPEHFNKDLFWNWVGKVDHNINANNRVFFRWGENERNEIGNRGNAIRSGPGQAGQLPLWRANRALVGDWVKVFGAGSVFNLRASYTYFLEWSYSEFANGFDSTEFWPVEPRRARCQARRSAASSRVITGSRCRDPVARLVAQPEPQLLGAAQRVDGARRAQHPRRCRHAVDQRLQRELQRLGRLSEFQP